MHKRIHKHLTVFIIAVSISIVGIKKVQSQWVLIPDSNFAKAIFSLAPSAIQFISGSFYMDTTNTSIVNINSLDVHGLNISDIEGIEYFDRVQFFNCKFNLLKSLPKLPPNLINFNCSYNSLSSIENLPQTLLILDCSHNSLDSLSNLPFSINTLNCSNNSLSFISLPDVSSLHSLDCQNNNLTSLPSLATSNLEVLRCSFNSISQLPPLPDRQIIFLDCSNNPLHTLPILPDSLVGLNCNFDELTSLPILPSLLNYLECIGNKLYFLPTLPNTITDLDCDGDSLASLPKLPDSLINLSCQLNQLENLPSLPLTLRYLLCNDNHISCLPLLPESLTTLCGINAGYQCLPNKPGNLTTIYGTSDLCDQTSSCFIYPRITGKAFNDDNTNLTQEATELGHLNFIIQVQPGNYYFPITDTTGDYSYVVDTGAVYYITASSIPYYNTLPTNPYITPLLSYAMKDSMNDFALQRTALVHDLIITSTSCQPARRDADISHTITAQNIGTVRDTASVQYVFDPFLTYINASPAPDGVSGATLTWNNIDLVPGQKKNFSVTFHIDNSIPLSTDLYSYAVMHDELRDSTPADNYDTLHQVVVGSFDPNEIEVNPHGDIMQTKIEKGQWMDYTIRFQNTGNADAFKVEIQDTITTKVDLGSIDIIASSHNMTWSIRKGIAYFDFNNINLPDSNSNEAASHGFVRYRIKADTNLTAGNAIKNTAYIYFDSNPAVVTNTTVNNVVDLPTNMSALAKGPDILVFPNPAKNELRIRNAALKTQQAELSILNALGQTVYTATINTHKPIDISSLEKGFYFVKLTNKNGVWSGRFVKE